MSSRNTKTRLDNPDLASRRPPARTARNANANTNTKHDFPVGVRKRINPPNLRLLLLSNYYYYYYYYGDTETNQTVL